MIVNSMTEEELLKEIWDDYLDVATKIFRPYCKKNRRILKNNSIKTNTLMVDKVIKTKRNNTVRIMFSKLRNDDGTYDFSFVIIFKVPYDNGKYRYYMPCTNGQVAMYSAHFMDRVYERAGLNAKDFFTLHQKWDSTASYITEAEWQGKKVNIVSIINGTAIIDLGKRINTFVTWLNDELLYNNQLDDVCKNGLTKLLILKNRLIA